MPKAWEKLDLQGAGVQSLQIRLRKLQKKPLWAYLLWLLFPFGAHRFYLGRPWAWAYPVGTALTVALALSGIPWAALLPGVFLILAAGIDLSRIRDWQSAYNKELRKAAWFSKQAPAAPAHYAGRENDGPGADQEWKKELQQYTRSKEAERAGHPAAGAPESEGSESKGPENKGFTTGKRALSFAEQERLLAEMARSRKSDAATRETGTPRADKTDH
ncbi:MAG: TM2 domain-containing protein [Acidithiobacillus sp.]